MKYRRILPLVSFLVLLLVLPVFAAGSIDVTASTKLSVRAGYGEAPIVGMEFSAYLVYSVDEYGELTPTEPFAALVGETVIRGENDEAWRALAEKLERELMLRPELSATAKEKTDAQGIAVFDTLPVGLYLIVSNGVQQDGYVYTTSAFFVMLPARDAESNTWCYEVTAKAKPAQNPVTADLEVIKLWKDDCHSGQRPQSISVDLLCDGEVYDTVTLPYNGHWNYIWHDLDVNHKWTVAEKRQDGYAEPEIVREGNTFILTNTCDKTEEETPPDLPDTGQLWWPVPVLLGVGLLLVIFGLVRRRGGSR